MNLKELSQLYHLNREIEEDRERLAELRANISSPAIPKYSDILKGNRHENPLENCTAEILDLRATIEAKQKQCLCERNRLERYIAAIPDSLTRRIFTYRFINGLPWLQVAYSVGGKNTEDSVKKICYRYLKEEEKRGCPFCHDDM